MALLEIKVNGREYQVVVDSTTSLLTVLREHLHITGPKIGCETGDCGACSVLVNGRASVNTRPSSALRGCVN